MGKYVDTDGNEVHAIKVTSFRKTLNTNENGEVIEQPVDERYKVSLEDGTSVLLSVEEFRSKYRLKD